MDNNVGVGKDGQEQRANLWDYHKVGGYFSRSKPEIKCLVLVCEIEWEKFSFSSRD